jgi:TPR repeat protein
LTVVLTVAFESTVKTPPTEGKRALTIREAAEQGDAEAQWELGRRYEHGTGVDQDQTEAVKWYRKAAEQGHVLAQFFLGICYHYGLGVEQDKTEAVKWYRKVAEQGDALAKFYLGQFQL